ncbi:MarR family winged helix-turn-helix transcriptional regulator [Rhizobium paknamense]|uniref:DNA-binding MarR family transcriptional regulator n=1 Tax=Rhizobium paknamense TaxID=1206817 RepID=A0ABU0IBD7_9HYPH|nr:MarR family transcriptional regulator [Rhizobium paknamense]MDQ0455537.1 DNA-binding MarR family transcriptional regulator [Rhizobium paknamense]
MDEADPKDSVDRLLAQWASERPDLDVAAMALIGRLNRLHSHMSREIEAVHLAHGLNHSTFDVLMTLRRAGPPYRLSPSELLATMMVTSGTMTNRIDQLEKLALVERAPHPEDGRSLLIALTDKGFDLADRAVTAHAANLDRLVAALSPQEQRAFDALLKTFLGAFEAPR